ncbi:MAG: hypothetical protein HY660_02220 [Armatimonadetes bacterium]|nr:hypothetical protein [Armatimonadota bacterium]
MKNRTGLISLTVALLTLTALAGTALPAPSAQGQAVIAMWGLPTRIIGSVEAVGGYVFAMIHDVLAVTDPAGQTQGRLAERWERSADGKTWTLHLRDAKFQDGQPVTAEDVKFSYEFYLHPRYPVAGAPLLEIEGARAFKEGKATQVSGIQVVGPRTVRFILTRRFAFFLDQITAPPYYIMPKHALAGADMARIVEHPYNRRPIGAGPFRLTDWRERESITFTAFPGYWGGRPNLERIVLRLVPEPATVMADLRAGNLDAGQILPDEFEAFQRERNLQTLRMPGDVSFWFSFNHRHPFTSDVRVRRAFYHAVDREAMVRVLQKGYGRVVNSPIHPSLWQHNAQIKGPTYDPERARALLREAGFAPGPGGALQRDGRPFRARYTFLSEKRYQDQALMIQQFFRQVGIELALEPLERGDFFGRFWQVRNSDNVEMVGLAWFNLLSPVQTEFEFNFKSTATTPRIVQYQNREIDALLDQAATATDRGALRAIYFRAQEVVLQDVPRVMTFRPDELWAVKRTLVLPKVNSLAEFFRSTPRWQVNR